MTKPRIVVERRFDGRWAVQKDGTLRASKLFPDQRSAMVRAPAQARRHDAEVVVKDARGRVIPGDGATS